MKLQTQIRVETHLIAKRLDSEVFLKLLSFVEHDNT